ncbi:hypothetical protein BTR23_21440 [Alkalihalophilus pseudofirmus]|uniref:HAD family hydrolase n=1 Tax=Alkalihalobacterium alkalinitrilicum TaxID=427920 RepID=UPI00094C67BD|nr:HAD family hydrolase [Alkalihalobacterium alkalinitrilicum]OLO26940.1 hypothetical protein BTR23_21440 [Alkalihalophilus pseudofirmus]
MRWRTICFDLDNTLFSHEEAFEKAICYCLEQQQQRWLETNQLVNKIDISVWFKTFKSYSDIYWKQFETKQIDARTYRRWRYHDTMKQYHLPYSDDEADAFHAHYYEIVSSFSEPFEGLIEIMNELKQRNITVGIITNGTADTQYRKVKKLGLENFICDEHIFVSEELGVAKPNRAIFDLALERLSHSGEKLFIGDSWEHDICGAIEAGWDAIYLNTRGMPATTEHQPLATFEKLTEVLNLLKNDQSMKG